MDIFANGQLIATTEFDLPLSLFETIYPDSVITKQPSSLDLKRQVQAKISSQLASGDSVATALSIIGKASNALSGALNIQLQMFRRLAIAQSFADVQAAVEPALPLMQRIQHMLERGELMSVQYAQGMSDEDAIVEALESMTIVARIIHEHEAALAS